MAYIDQTAQSTNALHQRYQIADNDKALLGVGNLLILLMHHDFRCRVVDDEINAEM